MTQKIDPALVKLTPTRPLEAFQQNGDPGYVVVWTSTCSTAPARIRFHSPQQWTPLLHASITARFADLTANSTYSYNQQLYYAGLPYDRCERTVKTALKATGYSAIARSS